MKTKVTICLMAVMAAMCVSCGGDEVHESIPTSDLKLEFSAAGDLILHNFRPVSLEKFNRYVLGHAWQETDTRIILSDGSFAQDDYWLNRLGGGTEAYEFSEGMVTNYFFTDALLGVGKTFRELQMHYYEEEGKLYFNEDNKFIVLSVSENEMTVIKKGAITYMDEGSQERMFLYVRLTKMSDDQLESKKKEYWVNFDHIFMPMADGYFCQKWVPWDGVSEITYETRKSDTRYITFLPDGTFNGKYDGTAFNGTYQYELDPYTVGSWLNYGSVKITPSDVLPGDFLVLFKAYRFELQGSSCLKLKTDAYQTDWWFISGLE